MAGHDHPSTTEHPTNPGTSPGTSPGTNPGAGDLPAHGAAGGVADHPDRLDHPDPHPAAYAHLRDLRRASADLARALMAAGYPPQRWHRPDPTLRELARALPEPTLAALFARLDGFSGAAGPLWLAGNELSARAAFTREAHLLDDIIRPLRALSLRALSPHDPSSHALSPHHHTDRAPDHFPPDHAPPDHFPRALEEALADPRTAAPLDQLAQATDALVALALVLAALPATAVVHPFAPTRTPAPAAAPATAPGDAPTVISGNVPTIAADAPFVPFPPFVPDASGPSGPSGAAASRPPIPTLPPPNAPTVPWLPQDATVPLPPARQPRPRRAWRLPLIPLVAPLVAPLATRLPTRPRRWGAPQLAVTLAIAACLACAAASIVLTFAPVAGPLTHATPAPTAPTTHIAAAPTHTRAATPTATPRPAHLAVTPTSLSLACSFTDTPSPLTLSDTGAAALTWQIANPPPALRFSATSGTLAPGATTTIQVRAVQRQHGTHSFTISASATNGSLASNAGSVAVSYTVCR